jgi:hypothetical protein
VPGEESPLVANAAVYRLVLNRGATEPATATNRVEVSLIEELMFCCSRQATAEFQAYQSITTWRRSSSGRRPAQWDPDYLALILPRAPWRRHAHAYAEGRTIRGTCSPLRGISWRWFGRA